MCLVITTLHLKPYLSCEVKSKAGVEAIVLPVEFPTIQLGSPTKGTQLLKKDQRDWSGMEKMKLIDTIPEWGPFYRVAFDLFLNSKPPMAYDGPRHRMTKMSSVISFIESWNSIQCYQCLKLWGGSKGIPELILEAESNQAQWHKFNYNKIEIKKWYKIELERRQLEEKVKVVDRNWRKKTKKNNGFLQLL